MIDDREAGGLRRSPFHVLSEDEINHLKNEISAIGADESIFKFNKIPVTGYHDDLDIITIAGNVFPD